MRTANGIVTQDKEVIHHKKKLEQVTSAVVGKNTPDLLSIGYRCQDLGYGFLRKPYDVPYIVLPDGKSEVDLHVDQYVPYLLDDGDTAIHKSCVSLPCAAFQSDIWVLDEETAYVYSNTHLGTSQIDDLSLLVSQQNKTN